MELVPVARLISDETVKIVAQMYQNVVSSSGSFENDRINVAVTFI